MLHEVHGVSHAIKSGNPGAAGHQDVLVIDSGNHIRLVLTSTYPADLSPDQARFIAAALLSAASRAEYPISKGPAAPETYTLIQPPVTLTVAEDE